MMDSGHNVERDGCMAAVVGVRSNGLRIFAHEFKLSLVRRCLEPGVSVASVAMSHQVNANLLRRWIVMHRAEVGQAVPSAALVPVTIQAPQDDAAKTAPTRTAAAGTMELEAHGVRLILRGEVNAELGRVGTWREDDLAGSDIAIIVGNGGTSFTVRTFKGPVKVEPAR